MVEVEMGSARTEDKAAATTKRPAPTTPPTEGVPAPTPTAEGPDTPEGGIEAKGQMGGSGLTFADCPRWAVERRALVRIVGWDLSLPAIVSKMVGGKEPWTAFTSFCHNVMRQKDDEKERRGER